MDNLSNYVNLEGSIMCDFLEMDLFYEPVCPSVGRLVGRSVILTYEVKLAVLSEVSSVSNIITIIVIM